MADWLAWQVVDSAFPTGAFAHSLGLEAAWQQGEVRDVGDLRRFLESSIRQAGCGALPLVNAAWRDPAGFRALDGLAEAFLTSRVANRASRVQGRTLAATVARVWPSERVEAASREASAGFAHLAPVSGIVLKAVGLPLSAVQRAVLFGAARSVLSAAVRLGIAGSFEAQRLQAESAGLLEQVACRCAGLGAADLAQTAPLIDLWQSAHDRLYSRLFQS